MAFSAFHIVYEYMERRPFPHFYGDSRRVLALVSTPRINWSPLQEPEQEEETVPNCLRRLTTRIRVSVDPENQMHTAAAA